MIGAMIVDISDGIDDGDVDCVVFKPVLLRDFLPPLPMVVVHQTSPNKIPTQYSINSDPTQEKVFCYLSFLMCSTSFLNWRA